MKTIKLLMMAALTVCLASCLGDDDDNPQVDIHFETVNFEKAQLPSNGVMTGQSYESENGYVFQNYYTPANEYSDAYNSGFTVSNNTDTKTPGYENQYSVFSASNNAKNQFLIYNPATDKEGNSVNMYIQRKDGQAFYPYQVFVAPTTYTMLSVVNGDAFAKKFTDKDTLSVTFVGCNAMGETIKDSGVKFDLIRNLGLFQYDAYYGYGYKKLVNVNGTDNLWTPIPLHQLGKVHKILITFDSTDKGEWGINTPMYLALDDFTTVAMESNEDFQSYLSNANN